MEWIGKYLALPSSLYTHTCYHLLTSGGSTLHCIVPWVMSSYQYTYLESFYINTKYTKPLVSTWWRVCTHIPLNGHYLPWLLCSPSTPKYTKV